jgi:hypothetical protein
MNGMTDSHAVGLINAQAKGITLAASIDLLKRANRYVGVHPSIGGQKLGSEITEFIAATSRQGQKP